MSPILKAKYELQWEKKQKAKTHFLKSIHWTNFNREFVISGLSVLVGEHRLVFTLLFVHPKDYTKRNVGEKNGKKKVTANQTLNGQQVFVSWMYSRTTSFKVKRYFDVLIYHGDSEWNEHFFISCSSKYLQFSEHCSEAQYFTIVTVLFWYHPLSSLRDKKKKKKIK